MYKPAAYTVEVVVSHVLDSKGCMGRILQPTHSKAPLGEFRDESRTGNRTMDRVLYYGSKLG